MASLGIGAAGGASGVAIGIVIYVLRCWRLRYSGISAGIAPAAVEAFVGGTMLTRSDAIRQICNFPIGFPHPCMACGIALASTAPPTLPWLVDRCCLPDREPVRQHAGFVRGRRLSARFAWHKNLADQPRLWRDYDLLRDQCASAYSSRRHDQPSWPSPCVHIRGASHGLRRYWYRARCGTVASLRGFSRRRNRLGLSVDNRRGNRDRAMV